MFSLINDYFPQDKITTANSILTAGPYIGAALSTLCVVIISNFGWRNCYILMGLFGVLTGLSALFFIKEPTR
jgi:MFS family permease